MATISQTTITDILAAVGGAENVAQYDNCMTRLRLNLHEPQRADIIAVKRIPGVIGVIESDGQFQIVLGPDKAQSAADLLKAHLAGQTGAPAEPAQGEARSCCPITRLVSGLFSRKQ